MWWVARKDVRRKKKREEEEEEEEEEEGRLPAFRYNKLAGDSLKYALLRSHFAIYKSIAFMIKAKDSCNKGEVTKRKDIQACMHVIRCTVRSHVEVGR